MRTTTFIFILATVMVGVVSSRTLRRKFSNKYQDHKTSRRKLVDGTRCMIYRKEIHFEPTPERRDGYSEEQWICEFSRDQSEALGMQFVEIVDAGTLFANATSGKSSLNTDKLIVDVEEAKMYIPEDAQVEISADTHIETRDETRKLASKSGTLKTLVVRVVDANQIGPDYTIEKIRNDVFEDEVCLKSQYERCSYGKVKIKAFNGNTATNKKIDGGVVNINIDVDMASGISRDVLQREAMKAANSEIGDLEDDRFDLIMFCMPPGSGNWLAYAFQNGKYSFYNNQWCSSVSAQMHEVGHNLGLGHSGEEGQGKYQDLQGAMGLSFNKDDQSMCFNPSKSFQLGWYEGQVTTINGLNNANPVRQYTLNGIADFEKNPNGLVALRLKQKDKNEDYYVGFNRKIGMNQDTVEDGNRITIVKKLTSVPTDYSQSIKVGSLDLGDALTIYNYNDQRNVEIKYIANKNGRDAVIEVIDVEKAPSVPTVDCKKYTVHVKTDRFPRDTSWTISEVEGIERVIESSPEYTEKEKLHVTEVCLPFNAEYKFSIVDNYKDGLCCSQGNGYYRVFDSEEKEIFSGGEIFYVEDHFINTGENPEGDPNGDLDDNNNCKDKRKKVVWKKDSQKKNLANGLQKGASATLKIRMENLSGRPAVHPVADARIASSRQ